jgi:cob(I)alamin adenosyltransferase
MSIATKTGDKGETSLMYGRRVPKSDPRVDAYGCVDELNSALGLARALATLDLLRDQLLTTQKDLINIMGELATAPEDLERYGKDGFATATSATVDRVTGVIDRIESSLEMKFNDWVIPGSSPVSAALDIARTTCRRAERCVAALKDVNPEILRYLNRLSDLCWLLARQVEAHEERSEPAIDP